MKNYFKDKNPIDIPFIESPFFHKVVGNSNYSDEELEILFDYHRNGYITIDLELTDEFVDTLLKDVKSELESLKTQNDKYHYSDSPRVFEAWKTIPNVLSLAKHPKIIDTLKLLYGRNPIPFQTINFLKGSNQPLHQRFNPLLYRTSKMDGWYLDAITRYDRRLWTSYSSTWFS